MCNIIYMKFSPEIVIAWYGSVTIYATVPLFPGTVDMFYFHEFHRILWMWSIIHLPFCFRVQGVCSASRNGLIYQ